MKLYSRKKKYIKRSFKSYNIDFVKNQIKA